MLVEHLKLIEQLSKKIAEPKSSKSRTNFKRELKAGADIIAFAKFCMQIEIWCANEFPNSKLASMRGVDSIFLASTNEEQKMDSAIFLQLSSALVDSSPAIQAVVSKHGGSALQSGHLLYRDNRIAFHGGVDKFKLNLRLILGKLKVNEQCCMDTFSSVVSAIKQETENLKVPLDNSEWCHFIEQAFVKSSIMKELVPTFRGRNMKIADILDIAKVHVQAPDIQEKLNSALGGGAFAASVTGRQNMGGGMLALAEAWKLQMEKL